MEAKNLKTGMYIINEEHKILYCNHATKEMYPELELGGFCYKILAYREEPCPHCPIYSDEEQPIVFYNPKRKEWITSNAAIVDLPDTEKQYCIQYRVTHRGKGKKETALLQEQVDAVTEELSMGNDVGGAIGNYCEDDFPICYVNEPMVEFLGYDNAEELMEAIDRLVINLVHPDDIAQLKKDLAEPCCEGQSYESIYRMMRKDGSWVWVVDRGKMILTAEGRMAAISVCADMTKQLEQHEKLLLQNKDLLRRDYISTAIINNIPGGYHRCTIEEHYPFVYISERFIQILGWTEEEIRTEFNNEYINLVFDEDRHMLSTHDEMVKKCGQGNSYTNYIYRMKSKDGLRWVMHASMFVDMGEESFVQGSIADITQIMKTLNQQKEQLESALNKLQIASDAKSEFLFNMSHDIRTPLNAIKGFTEIIAQNTGDQNLVKDMIGKIGKSSDVLMTLLNDVLELAQIENQKVEVVLSPMNLKAFTQKMCYMFEQDMEQEGIRFVSRMNLSEESVLCDELKLTQVIMNMLSNAKKFTQAGGEIVLEMEQTSTLEQGYANYRFGVRDTGIGMSEEFQNRAFEAFEREKSSTISGVLGTGLGMAIINKLVTLMGGTCTLESELGVGTYIAVNLRLQVENSVHSLEEETKLSYDFSGRRVLLVEDNEFNRDIVRFILESVGIEVEEAQNGEIALRKLTESTDCPYDLILMDVQMPVMDGYAATENIRHLREKKLANIPILAMTANAFNEDKKKCLEVGMNGHIGKPIDTGQLLCQLQELFPAAIGKDLQIETDGK